MTQRDNKTPEYFGKDLEAMSFATNYHNWILNEILPYLGESVAEIGAGTGSFSKLLLNTPIKSLRAFEPSKNMYPLLRDALTQNQKAEAINDFFGDESSGETYDSILYINVLEHIEDDAEELVNAYKSLHSNGHLLVFVPALPWLYSNLDKQVGHYRRYMKQNLLDLVKQAGFTLVRARYFDIAGIAPWYINFVLLKNSISSGSVSIYDKFVVPPMRFIEGLIPPPIGKNLLLIAKKP